MTDTSFNETLNESFGDVLKTTALAALLSIPGLVSAAEIEKGLTNQKTQVVQTSAPETQKKIYNILGKDRTETAIIVNIVARTLMAEGGGEKDKDSFNAIASVIWNRANGDKNRFIDVCLAPLQFSCWNKFNENDKKNFVIRPHGQAASRPSKWTECVNIATSMVNGTFTPKYSFTHYYNPTKCSPSWAKYHINTKTIGNHVFGNVDDAKRMADLRSKSKLKVAATSKAQRTTKKVSKSNNKNKNTRNKTVKNKSKPARVIRANGKVIKS